MWSASKGTLVSSSIPVGLPSPIASRPYTRRTLCYKVSKATTPYEVDPSNELRFLGQARVMNIPTGLTAIPFGSKLISEATPTFIIAEIGVNHNGDVDLAHRMIDEAAATGVDAVKFQTFRAETLVSRDAAMAEYQKKNLGHTGTQFEMLKGLELPLESYSALKEHAERLGVVFLSTPFDKGTADFLNTLGVVAFKIGSSDTDNIPLLRHIARFHKPMILSSGMSDIEELSAAVSEVLALNQAVVTLQCTTDYPCAAKYAHLSALSTIRDRCRTLVGFSDHTEGLSAGIAAVALGAVVIEKHFTTDRSLPGPDQVASSEPAEFSALVQGIRKLEIEAPKRRLARVKAFPEFAELLGDSSKQIAKNVISSGVMKVAKKSIVAACRISVGTALTEEMLCVKRPSGGVRPLDFSRLLGRCTNRVIQVDEPLNWEDLV